MASIIELENEYTIENGIIKNPGKFEGEPLSTPYYYDAMMESGGGEIFEISDDDRVIFPEIDKNMSHVIVLIDGIGFVSVEFHPSLSHAEDRIREYYGDDDAEFFD